MNRFDYFRARADFWVDFYFEGKKLEDRPDGSVSEKPYSRREYKQDILDLKEQLRRSQQRRASRNS